MFRVIKIKLKDIIGKYPVRGIKEGRIKKRQENIWDILDATKRTIYALQRPQKEKRKAERFYKKIMTGNFPNNQRKMGIQTYGAQNNLNRMDLKKAMQWYTI